MENYSLLMGDNSVDEDGGGVDGEAFRGHFPVPAACRKPGTVPQILASRWRRLWKVSAGFVDRCRVFTTEALSRRKGKVGGVLVGPHTRPARPGLGPRRPSVAAPRGPTSSLPRSSGSFVEK